MTLARHVYRVVNENLRGIGVAARVRRAARRR